MPTRIRKRSEPSTADKPSTEQGPRRVRRKRAAVDSPPDSLVVSTRDPLIDTSHEPVDDIDISADQRTPFDPANFDPKPATDAQLDEQVRDTGLSLRDILSDRWLRLTHLYYTKNKYGEKVLFVPWPEQAELLADSHYLNTILKARQRGITTAIQIFMLDASLFNENVNAGVIAHNREDAQKFFDDKIKFAYDNLPAALRAAIPSRNDNTNELSFSNGSSIRVGTSMRSGTLQYLHVSEYGKICAKYPDKAAEIRSGSLNTIAPPGPENPFGNYVWIESTAEGAHGHFYELCTEAEKRQMTGDPLTDMDYRFFFFPWWRAPEYTLYDNVNLSREDVEYFDELKEENGIVLSSEQMNWYVKKRQEQGDVMMTQEYPSTPEEAFRGIVDGAVFGKQLRAVRKEHRIMDLPILTSEPVNTFWDIGRDTTAIWFHQRVGPQNRFVDYHQEPNQSLPYFVHLLLKDQNNRFHKYMYGTHYFPHDIENTDLTNGENKTRRRVIEDLGMKPIRAVPRIQVLEEGVEMTRQALSSCYFDRTRCDDGIKCLENYRYEWDAKNETYRKTPLHNWASHGADSFRQFAQGYRFRPYSASSARDDHPLSRSSRATRRRTEDNDWRV